MAVVVKCHQTKSRAPKVLHIATLPGAQRLRGDPVRCAARLLFEADLLGGEKPLTPVAREADARRSHRALDRPGANPSAASTRSLAPHPVRKAAVRRVSANSHPMHCARDPTGKIRAASFRVRSASTTALITQIARASPCAIPASPPCRLEDESRVACLGISCDSIQSQHDLMAVTWAGHRAAILGAQLSGEYPVRLSQLSRPIVLTTLGRYRPTVDAVL